MSKVFLAFPFSNIMDENKRVIEKYEMFLKESRNEIIARGCEVFLAHYREEWGKGLMTAEQCTPLDLMEMESTALVLAFPGSPISGGVHIELGWASAKGKKIVLFLKNGEEYSPLIHGMNQVTDTEIIYYDDITDKNVKKIMIERVEALISNNQ